MFLHRCRYLALALVLALFTHCAAPFKKHHGVSDTPTERSIVLAPATPGSPYYSTKPAPLTRNDSLTSAIAAMVQEVVTTWGYPQPEIDGRLSQGAALLASWVGEGSSAPYAALAFVMSYFGIVQPAPHVLLLRVSAMDVMPIVAAFKERLQALPPSEYRWLGVGGQPLEGDEHIVILLLAESHIELEPVPRQLAVGETVTVQGHLLEGFVDASIYVTQPSGSVANFSGHGGNEAVGFQLHCEIEGQYQVEVLANGSLGPTVVANFPVWCGIAPPADLRLAVAPPETSERTPESLAHELLRLVNASRKAAGLAPLQWSDAAAEVALGHSRDMRDTGFVGHRSPNTGSPVDRAAVAGLRSSLLLENVARAYSAQEAHASLMNSPGHRANILHPRVTHLGVGVVLGRMDPERPELYVTQVFVRVAPRVTAKAGRVALADTVGDIRKRLGVQPLKSADELDALAQKHAESMARGERPAMGSDLDKVAGNYRRFLTVSHIVADASQITSAGLDDPRLTHVGIGMQQAVHPELGENAWFVVLHLAAAE